MRRKKEKDYDVIKMEKSHRPILITLSVVFVIYTFTLIFPFLWMVFNSLKDKVDFQFRQWEFTALHLENYTRIFEQYDLLKMFGNTLILCLTIPTLSLFMTCCLAYAVACFDFKLKNFLYYLSISVMFITVAGSLATSYKLMHDTGLIDTHIGLILYSSGAMGLNFMLMHAAYTNISPTYAEAAMIDGAGYWRTFLTIVSPQAGSTIIAIWILGFIGVWNGYESQYLYLPGHKTLSVGIKEISDAAELTGDYPAIFAIIVVTMIPILILFILFQKKIMRISLGGGIKE